LKERRLYYVGDIACVAIKTKENMMKITSKEAFRKQQADVVRKMNIDRVKELSDAIREKLNRDDFDNELYEMTHELNILTEDLVED